MRVIIKADYDALSRAAAEHVIKRINEACPTPEHPFVLGLPTGSSPIGMYEQLVKACKEGRVSFKNVVTFNMDEYVGLPEDHPESYHSFMHRYLFDHIDIPAANIHILNGNAPDLEAECAAYEAAIKSFGGIDLFLGGIGYGIADDGREEDVLPHRQPVQKEKILEYKAQFPAADSCDLCFVQKA